MSATERLRVLAVAPLWVACTATWSAASAVLLTWSAVQERRPR